MNKELNALEQAVVSNNEAKIIHFIRNGLDVSYLEVLTNVENIQNRNALYLLIKFGISGLKYGELIVPDIDNITIISSPIKAGTEIQCSNINHVQHNKQTLEGFGDDVDCSEALMVLKNVFEEKINVQKRQNEVRKCILEKQNFPKLILLSATQN